MSNFLFKLSLPLVAIALGPLSACAQEMPGRHPGYIRALSDLRAARWNLYHQSGDARVYAGEDIGIREIDAAIGEIKRAAIDDGKNLDDHPTIDTKEHGSRLLKSIENLEKARVDISNEEDNPDVRELRHHAVDHIERAIKAAKEAHSQWLKEVQNK